MPHCHKSCNRWIIASAIEGIVHTASLDESDFRHMLNRFVESDKLLETCMYGFFEDFAGLLYRESELECTVISMSNILVYRHSKHGTFTNIAMANECPCLSAAPTSSNILLSPDQLYHTESSWCVYSLSVLSKTGNDGLEVFISTVLHKALCGCNTQARRNVYCV